MTSPAPPLPVPGDDPLDAAASAVIDGVASPEEAALVAASPQGAARVAALRSVAGAVGRHEAAQGPAAAASALAAALAAFDAAAPAADGPGGGAVQVGAADAAGDHAGHEAAGRTTPTAPGAGPEGQEPPTSAGGADLPRPGRGGGTERTAPVEGGGDASVLPLARPRPSATAARWLPRLGAVAAGLVLLVGIGVLAVGLLGGGRDETASQSADVAAAPSPAPAQGTGPAVATAPASGAAEAARTTSAPAAPQAGARAPTAAAPVAAPVLDGGAFGNETDVEAVALRAATAIDSSPGAGPATIPPPDIQRCVAAGPAAAGESVGIPLYRAVGTYQGIPAVAVAYERGSEPARLLVVLARSDCSLLTSTNF